ncbi:MAG: VacJ family lipoprotein [Sulfurovum sp.]|nr:VacJ family lipoprotein [Sulfurovum sp.]
MKLLYFFIFTTVALVTFQGCTTKEATPDLNHQQVKTEITTSDMLQHSIPDNQEAEDQTDGFEDEFSAQETDIASDPLSGYNKVMTSFNDTFFVYLLNPIAKGYAYIIPEPLRIGISNAFQNIQFPIRFVNNLLQGKFQNSSDELERFIINSTVGVAGLMDVATNHMTTPIPAHDEDFGQTLGHYGVGSGFHIVLPFFGPSNVRDIVGLSADAYISPLVNIRGMENYKIPDNFDQSIGIVAVQFINKTSLHLGEYESLKEDAIDLYSFFRDTYEQKRASDIEE